MSGKESQGEWVRVPLTSSGGEMDAYLATTLHSRASVVLLQEIFGVNQAMREAAHSLADAGFGVLVPDLFWRSKPRVDLGYSDADRKEGFGLMQRFDQAAGVADIRDSILWLRSRKSHHGKVAVVGFCLGGRMAVLASASNPDVAAVMSFYGVRLDLCAEALRSLNMPFQLHVGDRDAHVPAEHVEIVKKVLSSMPRGEIFIYPGAQHGFFNHLRDDVFDGQAAAMARSRMLSMLERTLT